MSMAEANHTADQVSFSQGIFEAIDSFFLRLSAFLQTIKFFFYTHVGAKVDNGAQKLHAKMSDNWFGRYLLRVATAETDLRKIVKKHQQQVVVRACEP